jgi:hypothetical protein
MSSGMPSSIKRMARKAARQVEAQERRKGALGRRERLVPDVLIHPAQLSARTIERLSRGLIQ